MFDWSFPHALCKEHVLHIQLCIGKNLPHDGDINLEITFWKGQLNAVLLFFSHFTFSLN